MLEHMHAALRYAVQGAAQHGSLTCLATAAVLLDMTAGRPGAPR